MCRLNNEESWELFSNKVRIAAGDVTKPIKEQILKVCAGLPVVIIVLLGGLLSTKQQSYDEWSRVLSMLANKSTSTSTEDIMALSYQDLLLEAKPCFLYMGIFPRGFEIPVKRLIHLWCAEGFVIRPPDQEIKDPEDIAEMCLEELVTRNMVHVRWRLDGTPETCCMPSVVYDFFSSKAENAGFLHHLFKPSHTFPPQQQKFLVRRLAAYTCINYIPTSFHHLFQHLRSYVAFDNRLRSIVESDNHGVSIIKLQRMCEHQKLLQVYLLGNLPQSIIDVGFLPPNPRKLTLSVSGLEEDPMVVLGQLPHLNILRLFSDSYRGTRMTCRSNGFPKLRALKLR
ncbi:hypothetical protein Dsin_012222 [Dipteronia sinensis]|uniref:Disease resistance protein winged helix domain-containing protein n=1 Tax=Dipteronia sinensis TaxID=43782 RepID=A0AAE0AHN5_9ROSI|nr:hypothetical protein Dsin_012222 [Dipteronia sinensis]